MDASTQTVAPAGSPAPSRMDQLVRGAGLNILLVIAAGFLASLMFPPREVWWFAWVYLVPLLIALRRTQAVRAAGWLMLLFGLVFFACSLSWLTAIFGISVVGIFVIATLPWILFGLAYRTLAARGPAWLVVLLAPVVWVAVEWLRCEGWYFEFSWAQFGFTFASCRHGGVLYPYIGVYGATFLILLVNAALAEILARPQVWSRKLLGVAACAAVILPLSLYLNVPAGIPATPSAEPHAFRVALVQSENGMLDELKTKTLALRPYRPRLIIWPEYAIIDYPLEKPELLADLQAIAREMRATLVIGCKRHLPAGTRVDWMRRRGMLASEGTIFGNLALILGPDGNIIGAYQKAHPIPFFSDGVPGRAFPTFPTEVGRLGIAICYDFDFAAVSRRLTHNGAEILVAPTFDARDWTELQHTQHAHMAQARAAETGRWVLRATSSGVSQIIHPSGHVVAVIRDSDGSVYTTMGFAAVSRARTPYIRATYLLPYLCLAIAGCWAVWILGVGVRRRWFTPRPSLPTAPG